jgi:hypothetical protein
MEMLTFSNLLDAFVAGLSVLGAMSWYYDHRGASKIRVPVTDVSVGITKENGVVNVDFSCAWPPIGYGNPTIHVKSGGYGYGDLSTRARMFLDTCVPNALSDSSSVVRLFCLDPTKAKDLECILNSFEIVLTRT